MVQITILVLELESMEIFFILNHKFTEICDCDSEKSSAGLPVKVCGDFYQILPVNSAPVYTANGTMKGLGTFGL